MDSGTVARAVAAFEVAERPEDVVQSFLTEIGAYGGMAFTAADYKVAQRSQLLLYTSMPEVFTPLDRDSAWWADDPVVAELSSGTLLPFDVEDAWSKPLPSAAPRWEALTELKLHRGWVFPTSKPGYVGGVHIIADPEDYLRMRDHLDTLHLLATYMHAFMTEMDPDEDGHFIVRNTLHNRRVPERRSKLSPREMTCLRWVAFGKTAEEIAVIEGLSPHTVREYLRAGMKKLDSRTQAQAVARALRYGVISL